MVRVKEITRRAHSNNVLILTRPDYLLGRPFPLRGEYMANIFIHFEPTGHTLKNGKRGQLSWDSELPPYLQADGPWVPSWRQQNPYGWEKVSLIGLFILKFNYALLTLAFNISHRLLLLLLTVQAATSRLRRVM